MELKCLFQYIVNQLKKGSGTELLVLEELIQQMANVQYTENMIDEQDAMSGSETLRLQSSLYGSTRNYKVLNISLLTNCAIFCFQKMNLNLQFLYYCSLPSTGPTHIHSGRVHLPDLRLAQWAVRMQHEDGGWGIKVLDRQQGQHASGLTSSRQQLQSMMVASVSTIKLKEVIAMNTGNMLLIHRKKKGNMLGIEDNEPTARWLILTTIRDEQTVIPRTALQSQQLLLQCRLWLKGGSNGDSFREKYCCFGVLLLLVQYCYILLLCARC